MTWWVALSGGLVMLLSLLVLGVPVFAAFLVLNVLGVFVLFGCSSSWARCCSAPAPWTCCSTRSTG
jgi:hypothetical protein